MTRTAGSGVALRIARRCALGAALSLLLLEATLQAASLFARDRASAGRRDAAYTVLCVGDSHTYGVGVAPEDAYPAQLERLLDERAPGRYSVVNVGIPGMSTGQIRERLPDQVRRYEPDMILIWAGINNAWNRAGEQDEPRDLLLQLDRLASHSRVYRLARIWLHDRQLDRDLAVHGTRRDLEVVGVERPLTREARFTVRRTDGVIETIQHDGDAGAPPGDGWQARTERDYRAIVRYARSADIPIAFVGYPLGTIGVGGIANLVLRNVAEELDVPLVDSAQSMARIRPEEQRLLWAAHPDGRIYGEVARDLLPVVLRDLPPHD